MTRPTDIRRDYNYSDCRRHKQSYYTYSNIHFRIQTYPAAVIKYRYGLTLSVRPIRRSICCCVTKSHELEALNSRYGTDKARFFIVMGDVIHEGTNVIQSAKA